MAVCNGVIFFCEPRFEVVLVTLLLTNEAEDDRGFGLAGCGGAPPQWQQKAGASCSGSPQSIAVRLDDVRKRIIHIVMT